MKDKLNFPIFLICLTLISAIHVLATPQTDLSEFYLETNESFAPRIGRTFPEISLTDRNGKRWDAETLSGKVVYLNFWSTGCGPCLEEMPSLNTAYSHFTNNPNIVIIAINCFDSEERLNRYLKNNEMRMPVCRMGMEVVDLISSNGVSTLPTHFIIDQDWNLAIATIGGKIDIDKKLIGSIDRIANRAYAPKEYKEPNQSVDTTPVSAPR